MRLVVAGDLHAIWRAVRGTLGYGAASRSVAVRPADTFLVSYPRSGNTWLRFVLGNLVDPTKPVDFLDVERRVPDIYANSNRTMLRLLSPRLLKSHEYFDPRYEHVLYVVRDPRDIAPSYYRWQLKFGRIPNGYPASDFLMRFLDGQLDPYGSWQEHAGGWLGARTEGSTFRVFRYEDLLSDPARIARQLCEFLGISRSDLEIESAVSHSNRQKMRDLEQLQNLNSKGFLGKREDIPFVGEGPSAPFLDANEENLRSEQARLQIVERIGKRMSQLSYL
jgi:hypothetical protein